MSPMRKTAGQKAAATRKRNTAKHRAAAEKAALTRRRRAADKKAAVTNKHRAAGRKAAATRTRRAVTRKAAATRARKKEEAAPTQPVQVEEPPAPAPPVQATPKPPFPSKLRRTSKASPHKRRLFPFRPNRPPCHEMTSDLQAKPESLSSLELTTRNPSSKLGHVWGINSILYSPKKEALR
jgi:hypothetical protein